MKKPGTITGLHRIRGRKTISGVLLTTTVVFCIGHSSLLFAQQSDQYAKARHDMVRDFIAAEGVKNPRVLEAMRTVPRHQFMIPAYRKLAYFDGAFSIGYKQTISPPFVVAYMTEMIDPQKTDKVLEIGTGSGYQASVLSSLVKDVYTIEIVEPLGRSARRRLKKLGYDNVHAKIGDGYKGWPEHAPFDKIIVTCSPENVPKPLIEQLKDGGTLLIPLGERYQQVFYLYRKTNGELKQTKLIPTLFVPMTGISETNRKIKPDPLNPTIVNGNFETDDNNDGVADSWHYQRQTSIVSQDAPEGKNYLLMENRVPGRHAKIIQGFAIDGRKVKKIKVSFTAKIENTRKGPKKFDLPGLVISFYDGTRKPTKPYGEIGPWLGSSEWVDVTRTISVPSSSKEAIIQIGLNGATGSLAIDNLKFEPIYK